MSSLLPDDIVLYTPEFWAYLVTIGRFGQRQYRERVWGRVVERADGCVCVLWHGVERQTWHFPEHLERAL